MCEVGPAFQVEKDVLWDAWKAWCFDEGRDKPGTKAVFARDLRATVPGLTPIRPRDGEERSHAWRGVNVRQQSKRPLTTPDQDRDEADGQGSGDERISLNHAGGQGWSGVEPIVVPEVVDDLLECGHSDSWIARDGRRRCRLCDPPTFPSEVVAEAAA